MMITRIACHANIQRYLYSIPSDPYVLYFVAIVFTLTYAVESLFLQI